MLGVLPVVEDPDLSWSAAPALPQHLPPWQLAIIFQGDIPQVQVRQCQLPPVPDVLLAGGHVGGTPRRRLQRVQHVEDTRQTVRAAPFHEMRATGGRNGSYEAIAKVP